MAALTAEKCVACRADAPQVTAEEIADFQPQIPDWSVKERQGIPQLERVYAFRNFTESLAFTNQNRRLGGRGRTSSRNSYRVGGRHRVVVDPQDSRAAPQRLHHGGQDRRALSGRLAVLNATATLGPCN